ncbi:MAG: hypothetical protein MUO21_05415 [Nitrososphaeraceae archaeon]|nr:hypothetical protein [Nitrososphaeraceae archaeon]
MLKSLVDLNSLKIKQTFYKMESTLGSLSNITSNISNITHTVSYVDVTYFDAENYVSSGCRGWYGPGQDKPPKCAQKHVLSIIVPKDKISDLTILLTNYGFHKVDFSSIERHYIDNGLSFCYEQKLLNVEYVTHIKVVEKEPWFDEVLDVIRKYKPDYTETELIGEVSCCDDYNFFNESVVKNIKHPHTETKNIYDQVNDTLNVCVVDDDIPTNLDRINSVVGGIFSLISNC